MNILRNIRVFAFVSILAFTSLLLFEAGQSRAEEGVLYGVNCKVDGLFSIGNTETRSVNFIGRLDPDYKSNGLNSKFVTPVAMAVRPSDETVFVWNNSDKGATRRKTIFTGTLLKVDKATGLASVVGPKKPKGLQLYALAFGPDGILYGLNDSLYKIDTYTGETRPIGSSSSWFYWLWLRIGAADFDPFTGTLYAIERRFYDSQRLITVNTKTGDVTMVGKISETFAPIGSMVFTRKGTIIGSGGTSLFEMDITGKVLRTWKIKSRYVPCGIALVQPFQKTK